MQPSSSHGWSKPLSGSSSFPDRVESYLSSLTRSSARSSNLPTELCTASSTRASRSSRCFALPVFCGQHSRTRSGSGYRSLLPLAGPGNFGPFEDLQNGVRESSEPGELPAVRFPPPPLFRFAPLATLRASSAQVGRWLVKMVRYHSTTLSMNSTTTWVNNSGSSS